VLFDDLDRLLELLLQLVSDLTRTRVDRHRVNNRHVSRPLFKNGFAPLGNWRCHG
jgi:hypothetical protein